MVVLTRILVAIVATAGLVTACGGDDDHNPLPNYDSGPEVDADPDEDIDAGDDPGDPDGPTVELLSPDAPAAGDYSAGAIVVDDRFTATCRVTRNSVTNEPVDPTSVRLTATVGNDTFEVDALPNGNADEYEGTLDVTGFANGALDVSCTASDTAAEPRSNSDDVDTFLDLGPSIDIFSPNEDATYGQQVDLSFSVTAQPVAADDDGADVEDVVVRVNGVLVTATPTGGGTYFVTVVFDDDDFVPSLDGEVVVTIEGSNSRTTRFAAVEFLADSEGPVIVVNTPDPAQLVSGFMDIEVNVTDPAGIASVVATLAGDFEVELFNSGGNNYIGSIDTRQLSTSFVFPLLQVRAQDAVGNEASVGRVVTLDNRAPLVSMDSPSVREAICISDDECLPSDTRECSTLFDPLGSDAADDGELVGQLIEMRVRAEDRGNGAIAPTGVDIPLAGTAADGVTFYVLDDQNGELLVDTGIDGICDAINPLLVPTSVPDAPNEAALVSLVPVGPDGSSYFAGSIGAVGGDPEIADDECVPAADPDDTAPSKLCTTTPLTRMMRTLVGDNPVIFTIPPTDDPSCAGNAFDAAASNISDGWACVVAVAEDNLGNVGFSAPLRICIDSDDDNEDGNGASLTGQGCAADYGLLGTPPIAMDCTDGCAPPESFENFPVLQVRVLETVAPEPP